MALSMHISSHAKLDVQVIDETLLTQCLIPSFNDTNVTNESNSSANLSTHSFGHLDQFSLVDAAPNVEELYLSFKRILKIENLVAFDSLKKLYIDNNIIEEITNLSHLRNLRWLDLSFNGIRKIQGLESLTFLEDLSLYSNKISVIEGLEGCPNLTCLSLGNNRIEALDQIQKLRSLKKLRVLTLLGNPVSKASDYRVTVLAYIDTLKYLDYGLIYDDERSFAVEQFHDIILDVIEKETVLMNEKENDQIVEKKIKRLEEAGILFAHTLFDDIFAMDADLERLKHLPGVRDSIEQFRREYMKLSDEFIKQSIEKHEKKVKEMNNFENTVKNIRSRDDNESTQLINNFFQSKKLSIVDISDEMPYAERKAIVDKLENELDRVCDELLNIEVHQSEKFESVMDEFDNRLVEMKSQAMDMQQIFFRNVEELEKKYYESVRSVASDLIDRQSSNLLPPDFLDDDALTLVIDREACLQIVQSSHESHLGRIMKREYEATTLVTKRYHEIVSKYTKEERQRNRDRILQIHEFSTSNKERLAVFHNNDDEDGYEDDELHGHNPQK